MGIGIGSAAETTLRLTVRLDLRAEIAAGRFDPARDRVGLRGALPPLSWAQTLLAAPTGTPGVYEVALTLAAPLPAQGLAYKFKREREGRPDEGWENGRNRVLRAPATGTVIERAWGDDPELGPPRRTGRIERIALLPSAFVAPREVQVWLPPGYESGGGSTPPRRYPVLYLHDGENVFDHLGAGLEWGVDETAQRLVTTGAVEPFIVVAIGHAGTRMLDYTPVPARPRIGQPLQGGGAPAYGRYLVQELKPLIDARFRTLPGREHTAVGGSSLGGLVSMWLVLEHGDVFGAALVVSPSVWWGGRAILDQLAGLPASAPTPRLWLDVGSAEGWHTVADARALRDALARRGWPTQYLEAADAGHDEAAWAARVEGMLRFLYAPAVRR